MTKIIQHQLTLIDKRKFSFFSFSLLTFLSTGKSRSQSDEGDDDKAQRRSKKVSSLCIQLPAAGLGQRPPSVHSSITDEGGFNEPSPEIKALKPVYDFENDIMPPVPPIPTSHHPDVISGVTYVDLAHRAQPEGIESDEVYDENESYRRLENGGGAGEETKEKVVYATIKPEVPVKELLYEKENILDIDADEVKVEPQSPVEKSYISPQRLLDPTRARLHDDDEIDYVLNKKLPPEPPGEMSETETEEEEEKPKPPKKIPPPIPELNSPLDLNDVEFADASDEEEEAENCRKTSYASEQVIPDAMTADEADRLLSSRWVLKLIKCF